MQGTDIRWIQRLENFRKALERLNEAATIIGSNLQLGTEVTDLLREGLIQRFEYTHELAWNVMKDYAEYQGNTEIRGSRDAIRWALQNGLADDKAWMKSIEDRNLSSHDYDRPTADAIFSKVIGTYLPLFNRFEQTMVSISKEEM
jgi:nucleotidyltransferase substrate binding protein (TIGR01987 family)